MTPKTQKIASLAVAALGLALLVMMVATEGEPGALPLGLVLLGAIGYGSARIRQRSRRARSKGPL